MSQPAAFLDRDGVLNHRIPGDTYVTRPEELVVLPHAAEGVRELARRGYLTVVVTNQRGVGRGLMSLDDLEAVHQRLHRELSRGGARLDAIYACPHDRDAGCACRKPRPGLLLQAARELDLDLSRSLLVGDSDHDLEAGRAAGVPLLFQIESDGDLRAVLGQVPDLSRPPAGGTS